MPRRLRGLLGTMLTWGVTFSAIGSVSFAAVVLSGALPRQYLGLFPSVAVRGFVVGAISGALFALLLMRRERNRTVSSISTWRAAGWGFVGAAALPVLTVLGLGYISVVPIGILVAGTVKAGLLGAGVAASMITIARRAERRAQLEIAPRLVE